MLHLTYFGCPDCGEEQGDWLEPLSRITCVGRWHDGDRYACVCGETYSSAFKLWFHRLIQGPLR